MIRPCWYLNLELSVQQMYANYYQTTTWIHTGVYPLTRRELRNFAISILLTPGCLVQT